MPCFMFFARLSLWSLYFLLQTFWNVLELLSKLTYCSSAQRPSCWALSMSRVFLFSCSLFLLGSHSILPLYSPRISCPSLAHTFCSSFVSISITSILAAALALTCPVQFLKHIFINVCSTSHWMCKYIWSIFPVCLLAFSTRFNIFGRIGLGYISETKLHPGHLARHLTST